jgi:hypothetical protein
MIYEIILFSQFLSYLAQLHLLYNGGILGQSPSKLSRNFYEIL